jgi:hypothetical protein
MDEPRLASWKYQHNAAGSRSKRQLWLAGILFVACLLTAKPLPPLAVFLLIVTLLVFFNTSKTIMVGPRYLICGEQIVYFANITRVKIDGSKGTLRLTSLDGSALTLERSKFPTNARKADKIKRNQAAKFSKVAKNLSERVRKAAPEAVIESDEDA